MTDQEPEAEVPSGVEAPGEPADARIEILGGAGPYEAAAIMAAIDAALTEELATQALPSEPARPGAWFMSGRPQVVLGPRTTYQGLSPSPGSDDENGGEA
jgi:hypothetical protein